MKRFVWVHAVMVVACWAVLGVFAGAVQAQEPIPPESFFDVYFDVDLPNSTSGPPYPSTPLKVMGVKPGMTPIPVEIIELSLLEPLPLEQGIRLNGWDSGDPDGPGPESFFDVEFDIPPIPPDSFFDVFFELMPPEGMPPPIIVRPPSYEFVPPESFFDVFFDVDIPGEGLFRHQLHGELDPSQPLALRAVGDGGFPTTESFFDVFFELDVTGPVDPGIPFLHLTLTAERVVPEPAGLGLLGLALLALSKRRK